MANIIGKIVSGNGSFFIKHPDGTLEVAKVGSTLFEGDKLIGSSSNSNENSMLISLVDSGQTKVVGSNEQLFDITLLSGEIPEDTVVPNSQVGDLLEQATNNQQDPNQNNEQATLTLAQIENLDAAAAGADQTTTEPVGIVPLRLEDRTAGETNVVTDLRDAEETLAVIDDTVEADNTVLGEILTEAPIEEPEEPVPDLTASEPNLDIVVNETIKYNKIGTTTVIDTDKNEEEGIFSIGDNYYKNIDIDVLLNGNDKIILNKGSKESTGNLTLGGDTNTLSLTVDLTGNENGHGQSQANGEIIFYNDGEPQGSLALVDGKYAYTTEYLFDTFEVRHTGSSGNGSSSIHIDAYEATIMQEVEPYTKEIDNIVTSYEYDISLDALSTDTDGSETLSDVSVNIGGETIIISLDENGHGEYLYTSDDQIPKDSIEASVISTESNGGDTFETFAYVDSNDGVDTLRLTGGSDIDFPIVDISNIKDIEQIDLSSDSDSNYLTKLSFSDVVEMTDSEGESILRIMGDSSDSVSLVSDSGTWSSVGTQNIDSIDYNVYSNSEDTSYKVLIQNTIQIDLPAD
jgi:hypothetical protein